MTVVCTIAYTGTLWTDQITTTPWKAVGVQFPERGAPPTLPQVELDVLQPRNLDGARYRIGGAHFPQYKMRAIFVANSWSDAQSMARQMELIKGDYIQYFLTSLSKTFNCMVIDAVAMPNAAQVVGASAGYMSQTIPGGGAYNSGGSCSVDAMFTLQGIAS